MPKRKVRDPALSPELNALKNHRLARGHTQMQAAEKVGVTVTEWSAAEVHGVNADELLSRYRLSSLLAMIFSRTRYRDKQGRDWSPTGGDPDKGIIHLSHPDSDTGMDVKLSTLLNTFEVIRDE